MAFNATLYIIAPCRLRRHGSFCIPAGSYMGGLPRSTKVAPSTPLPHAWSPAQVEGECGSRDQALNRLGAPPFPCGQSTSPTVILLFTSPPLHHSIHCPYRSLVQSLSQRIERNPRCQRIFSVAPLRGVLRRFPGAGCFISWFRKLNPSDHRQISSHSIFGSMRRTPREVSRSQLLPDTGHVRCSCAKILFAIGQYSVCAALIWRWRNVASPKRLHSVSWCGSIEFILARCGADYTPLWLAMKHI